MNGLPRAEGAPELLDLPSHDARELAESLAHVAAVNRWLGGARSLLAHVTTRLQPGRITRVLDVGTGSADLPRALVRWCRHHHRPVHVVACDVHPQVRAIAQAQSTAYPELSIHCVDARALPFRASSFDIATISLTLHHFDGDEQVRVLRELARVAPDCVIVNELRRTRLNHLGARLLAHTLWRRNRITRHDGPLSVLRAFMPSDLLRLCAASGLQGSVFRHFFQRVVLVAHS